MPASNARPTGPADQTDPPYPAIADRTVPPPPRHRPAARVEHLPEPLPPDPFPLFVRWYDEAHTGRDGEQASSGPIVPNPNAFTLATIDPDGRPSARIVLCKGMDPAAGWLVFYTNYLGRKGRALAANPRAAAVFHWDVFDRQARFEGPVVRATAGESDAYFASRPWMSRVGAWTSNQSEPVATREDLVAQLHGTMRRFGIDPANPPAWDAPVEIPRPPHWGGFRLVAERVELWCAGSGRLHERGVWERELRSAEMPDGTPTFAGVTPWTSRRLQP